jgi:hypothetical protein
MAELRAFLRPFIGAIGFFTGFAVFVLACYGITQLISPNKPDATWTNVTTACADGYPLASAGPDGGGCTGHGGVFPIWQNQRGDDVHCIAVPRTDTAC